MFRMYQHVFFTLKDKQIHTTKRKHPRQVEIGCIFSFQKGAVYSNMNEKPLFFLIVSFLSYLRKGMTKLCIKMLVKSDSALESAFP